MEFPLLFFQSLFLSLFILLLFKTVIPNNQNLKRKPKLPPGPWTLPFIGSIHHLIGYLPHRRLRQLSNHHGPLLHLKLGEIHYFIASSSSAAHEVLKTHDLAFASRPALMAIKTISYNCAGIGFSPYGPYWRQLRRLCTMELLSNKRVKSFVSIRQEEAAKLISKIRAGGGSSAVNLTEMFLTLTNNYLTRAAFGKECRSRNRFLKAMKETIKLAPVLSLMDLFPSLAFLISKVDGKMKKMRKLHVEMDGILDEIIEEHRVRRRGVRGEEMKEDLVDVLLRVQENGELEIPLKMVHVKAVILEVDNRLLLLKMKRLCRDSSWVSEDAIHKWDLSCQMLFEKNLTPEDGDTDANESVFMAVMGLKHSGRVRCKRFGVSPKRFFPKTTYSTGSSRGSNTPSISSLGWHLQLQDEMCEMRSKLKELK